MLSDDRLNILRNGNSDDEDGLSRSNIDELFDYIDELEAENREQSAELTFCIATIERTSMSYDKLRDEWKAKNA